MSAIQQLISTIYGAVAATSATATSIADSLFSYTTFLLSTQSYSGGSNNTIKDSSTNNFSVTRTGKTAQGTFSPFSPTGWAGSFNGAGYLVRASGSPYAITTSDFTIEAWVMPLASGAVARIFGYGTVANNFPSLCINASLTPTYQTGTSVIATGPTALKIGQWAHVACVRSANAVRVYVNGVGGTTVGHSTNWASGSLNMGIGASATGETKFTGYISNLRLLIGAGPYTANFTPSTTKLAVTASTKLLTLQDSRFKDNSASNASIAQGAAGTSIVAASPFNTTSYDPALHGGSLSFDGANDYVSVPSSSSFAFGTNDFTTEFWFNPTTATGSRVLVDFRSNPTPAAGQFTLIFNTSNQIQLTNETGSSTVLLITSTAVITNQWHHVALVKQTGTFYLYVNGSLAGSKADGRSVPAGPVTVAADYLGATKFAGYMSNLRVVSGTAVYTAAFTPDTAPLTAVANTQLLLSCINSTVTDVSNNNDFIVAGNVVASTTDKKYGDTSLYFDGTGDYIYAASPSPAYSFGTGDFTVEFWVKPLAGPVSTYNPAFYSHNGTGSWNTNNGFRIHHGNILFHDGTQLNFSGAIQNNVWTHVAIVRSGTTIAAFRNGISIGSVAVASTFVVGSPLNQPALCTSDSADSGGREFMQGYIDDFRITRGSARYTPGVTFTPPGALVS